MNETPLDDGLCVTMVCLGNDEGVCIGMIIYPALRSLQVSLSA